MNKVKIICDSTCDLDEAYVKENDVEVVALHVSIKGDPTDYLDGVNLKSDDVYKLVEKYGVTPKTGARNAAELTEDFRKFIDQGYDIIFTGIGAELSSTYNNAVVAAQNFPEGRIEVIDSESLSTGAGLLVTKMVKFRNEGDDVHEIARKVRELVPLVSAKFCIDRLDYLAKGGRCSGMTKIFAHMLKIHPVAKMINGKLEVYKKPRGDYHEAIKLQVDELVEDLKNDNVDLDTVFVTDSGRMNGDDDYTINEVAKYVKRENIRHTVAGCVVCSHCGPKTIGILYITKKPR